MGTFHGVCVLAHASPDVPFLTCYETLKLNCYSLDLPLGGPVLGRCASLRTHASPDSDDILPVFEWYLPLF
jgi:hypothetical protein